MALVHTTKKKTTATVIAIGAAAPSAVHPDLEKEAARLAAKKGGGVSSLLVDGHRYILTSPDGAGHLIGGENWRLAAAQAIKALRSADVKAATLVVEGEAVQSFVEGCILADYRFTECSTAPARPELNLHLPGNTKAVQAGIAVAAGQNLARTLADCPPNILVPKTFIQRAKKALRGTGLSISTIEGKKKLTEAGFPGLVTVGKGSIEEPALLTITYKPSKKQTKKAPKIALVGKGMTFDSGGISLKPGTDMWMMKADRGGAAAVLGAMSIVAAEQPNVQVTAYIALAENMPDAAATKPGDVYQARNGKYVHVDNTDAEGRLILSDVLTYAGEEGASHIIDVATLTGACMVALGKDIAGVMTPDQDWASQIRDAGLSAGEECWPLPLYGGYDALLSHPHADVNNMGGRFGGAITAGLFLQRFVSKKATWAHLDIAGPAIRAEGWRYYTKGMTGFGTRTLAAIVRSMG